ncbi:FAD-binding protein [Glarea lozoyensis ATCC 20868]|uniref:FAD-binding protein n=1 Tax=Glarea lozoyensis (strain ATCC 20868 / MF5171) TaxID=1116229 RepID=S3DSU4_GLAL2|nr:FAD-binding protein [Glarea lozoyensis ATCC 20868]EPE29503.1 FAD-binding protein [Glarea lozoyensis ATCC 20868]
MAPTVGSFLSSVGVVGAEVGSLTDAYEKKTSPSLFVACFSTIGQEVILLDLQRLNQDTLSEDKTFASLGPGGRWGTAIAALDAQEATIIGGRIPDVGIGGLILGDGLFRGSGEYGLAADNVKNFENTAIFSGL